MSRILALLAAAVLAAAAPSPARDLDHRNPGAPPETDQFAFLVGTWSCTTRSMLPDGSMVDGPPATWTGRWILDGYAIQDDWATTRPEGTRVRGTNIRSFNPETRVWDNRWLANGTLQWQYFSAEQVGDTMVMTGGEGVDPQGRSYLDRNTFYDIGPDAWKWKKDRSYDGGETWLDGVAFIEATRAR